MKIKYFDKKNKDKTIDELSRIRKGKRIDNTDRELMANEVKKVMSRIIASLDERIVVYRKDNTDRRNFNTYTFYRGKLLAYSLIYAILNSGIEYNLYEKVASFPLLEDYDGMDCWTKPTGGC